MPAKVTDQDVKLILGKAFEGKLLTWGSFIYAFGPDKNGGVTLYVASGYPGHWKFTWPDGRPLTEPLLRQNGHLMSPTYNGYSINLTPDAGNLIVNIFGETTFTPVTPPPELAHEIAGH